MNIISFKKNNNMKNITKENLNKIHTTTVVGLLNENKTQRQLRIEQLKKQLNGKELSYATFRKVAKEKKNEDQTATLEDTEQLVLQLFHETEILNLEIKKLNNHILDLEKSLQTKEQEIEVIKTQLEQLAATMGG